MIYVIILSLLIILVYYYDIQNHKKNLRFWYIAIQIIFILLAGLRFRIGTDTPNYIYRFYHVYPSLSEFSFYDYPIGGDGPLYVLLNSFVISLGGKFYVVQLIQAAFVISLIFHYFRKHSDYLFSCALFYFIVCYIQFDFEIMRGSMCIAVCLFANDYVLEKKWFKAYTLYIIALFLHVQAIVLFIVPLFKSLRLNLKGLLVLIVAFFVGFIIQYAFGDFIEMLSFAEAINDKAARYAENDIYNSSGGNVFFYIVYIFPLLLYSLTSLGIIKQYKKQSSVLAIEPFVMIGIITLLIQMNLQIFSRYVDFFEIYLVMVIAEFFVLISQTTVSDRVLGYVRSIVFFIPFFFLTFYGVYKNNYQRILPYNSVFDRKLDHERENAIFNPMIEVADINEY